MKKSYLEGPPQNMAQAQRLLKQVLGTLRALDWHYRTAHWQVHGQAQYGDHLLFQRFYEAIPEEVDTIAEKMVGYFGPTVVDAFDQLFTSLEIMKHWSVVDCPFKKSLLAETDLQDVIKICYRNLKELDLLPLGLDDYLMALASDHETNLYLLQQRLYDQLTKKATLTSLEKSWSGDSTFAPMRHGVREEDPLELEDEKSSSGPAEHYFRPSPLHREVRELGQGGRPPTPKEIIENDPYHGEFSSLGRYVVDTAVRKQANNREAKKQPSKFIPGLVYEYPKGKFAVTHEDSGLKVINYESGIRDPESFMKLADRVLRDMDWKAPNFVLEKEKSRQLTRQFQRHIELVPDPETGDLFYRVAGHKS